MRGPDLVAESAPAAMVEVDGGCSRQTTDLIELRARLLSEVADRLDAWEFPPGSDALEPMYRLVADLRARSRDAMTVNTFTTLPRVTKPPMVMRSIRVPEKLWDAAKAKADEREESISDVIREALERYVRSKR